MTIVELKKEYRKQLDIIKNEKNGISVRKGALETFTDVYYSILKMEPKTKIESPSTVFKRYIEKLDVPKVVWYTKDQMETASSVHIIDELRRLEVIRKLAYFWVKQNHPLENDQSDKFGQIVNSRMHLIIASRQ